MELKQAASTDPVRLDLACGKTPREGFRGVDLYAEGAEKVDLWQFPWPWADGSVDELHCSHHLEHIPATALPNGKDMLCAFMDEAWRVLKDKSVFTVIVPCARSNRAFQDPTHRRFFVAETFLYFNKAWRESQGLGHYLGVCDFGVEVNPIIPTELSLLHPEAAQRRFNGEWNTVLDWQARLVAHKP